VIPEDNVDGGVGGQGTDQRLEGVGVQHRPAVVDRDDHPGELGKAGFRADDRVVGGLDRLRRDRSHRGWVGCLGDGHHRDACHARQCTSGVSGARE
jgi:hypothetical protein